MKKRISMLLALVFVFSVLFIPVQAADTAGVAVSGTISLDDLDSNPDVIVSDPMTFTEMIARMAKNADMSYDGCVCSRIRCRHRLPAAMLIVPSLPACM
ncbi:MAG: hypothetical protein V8S57_05700 [Oscillospiraceae bacterium]